MGTINRGREFVCGTPLEAEIDMAAEGRGLSAGGGTRRRGAFVSSQLSVVSCRLSVGSFALWEFGR